MIRRSRRQKPQPRIFLKSFNYVADICTIPDLENLGRKWTEFPFLANMVLEGQAMTESGDIITTDYQKLIGDINVCMRAVPNSNLEGRADKIKDNEDAWALLHRFKDAS